MAQACEGRSGGDRGRDRRLNVARARRTRPLNFQVVAERPKSEDEVKTSESEMAIMEQPVCLVKSAPAHVNCVAAVIAKQWLS